MSPRQLNVSFALIPTVRNLSSQGNVLESLKKDNITLYPLSTFTVHYITSTLNFNSLDDSMTQQNSEIFSIVICSTNFFLACLLHDKIQKKTKYNKNIKKNFNYLVLS